MLSDDAEVRKIVKGAHLVREKLGILTTIRTMTNLLPSFKVSDVLSSLLRYNVIG